VVKLNNRKIAWIVKHVSSGEVSTKDAADIYGITQRGAQQFTKKYLEQRKIPEINPNRRPKTSLTRAGVEGMQSPLWEETRFGSRHLYKELKRRGYKIPKNKLIRYMKETGKSMPSPNKQKKRKRCRYEREHSFSLVHVVHAQFRSAKEK
jgi:putative transposase